MTHTLLGKLSTKLGLLKSAFFDIFLIVQFIGQFPTRRNFTISFLSHLASQKMNSYQKLKLMFHRIIVRFVTWALSHKSIRFISSRYFPAHPLERQITVNTVFMVPACLKQTLLLSQTCLFTSFKRTQKSALSVTIPEYHWKFPSVWIAPLIGY